MPVSADLGARQTDRQVGWLISLGGAILVLGIAASGFWSAEYYPIWWNACAAAIALAVLVLAVAGRWLPFTVLRIAWIGIPTTAVVLWFVAFAVASEPSMPWAWMLQAVVAAYPVLWLPPAAAIAFGVLAGAMPTISALTFLDAVPRELIDSTPVHLTNVLFTALFIAIRARLTRLRCSEADASARSERSARTTMEAHRQARIGRLIHDEVLSVLSAARSFDGTPPATLRAEAAHALALLEAPSNRPQATTCPTDAAAATISAALRRIDPTIAVQTQVTAGEVPAGAVQLVTLAATEAVRNSVRHAGVASTRQLVVRVDHGRIEAVVRDDGTGFDPAAIPSSQLGVRESILGRMRHTPGGDAHIRTAPGEGTEVTITWGT